MHILTRFFERYGSPGNVGSDYKEFSEWYLKTFSQGILASIFKLLDAYRRGIYVSPRVMQQALNYVNTGVSHAATWKLIKVHILEVIKVKNNDIKVLFIFKHIEQNPSRDNKNYILI